MSKKLKLYLNMFEHFARLTKVSDAHKTVPNRLKRSRSHVCVFMCIYVMKQEK